MCFTKTNAYVLFYCGVKYRDSYTHLKRANVFFFFFSKSFCLFHNKLCFKLSMDKNFLESWLKVVFLSQFVDFAAQTNLILWFITRFSRKISKVCWIAPKAETVQNGKRTTWCMCT